MCGIVGAVGKNLKIEILSQSVKKLSHRGPDSQGIRVFSKSWLGHTRLSILDLDERSDQPFSDSVDECSLVYNGEIYNFKELRQNLVKDGIVFKTNSDTEVILHSWRKWGYDCFLKFKGMFALAIWDPKKEQLLMAKDRFGEKPLYYLFNNETLYFASEFKIITKFSESLELDPHSINDYFYWGYIPSPNCLIKGVKKLRPGHYAIYKKNNFEEIQYYKRPAQTINSKCDQIESQIHLNLSRAIERSLVSDVPVGISLSGGIDSCAIAAFASKNFGARLKCISVGYKGRPKNDERDRAKKVSNQFNHEFHEVEISHNDIKEHFKFFLKGLDEPISDIAGFSYDCVFRKAKEIGLKAILSGIGGDEFFWGYPIHNIHCLKSQHRQALRYVIPRSLWSLLFKGYYGWKNQIIWNSGSMISEFAQDFLEVKDSSQNFRFPANTLTKRSNENWNQSIQRVLVENWLEGNCLTLNDRLSMRYSIECRSPFLDADLTNYALSIKTAKDTLLSSKKKLKLSLNKVLPQDILSAPKSGFTPPVNLWKKIICENFSNEFSQCQPLKEFVRLNTVEKTNYDLMYRMIIISFLINQIITN